AGRDLAFSYTIRNLNSGHNLPSGSLGAQPQLWVNVALIDPDGRNVWESGYVDSNGDLADLHSLDVAAGRIKTDQQLVNFQTKFLTTNVKGTDREMYLPVNFDIDPLPHLRPPQIPTTVLNHPPLVRMENHSLPPLGWRQAKYHVPGHLLKKPGKYRLAFRLRSRAEPIYFMRFVGADKDIGRASCRGRGTISGGGIRAFHVTGVQTCALPIFPTTVLNHPPLVRMENHSLPPLGWRQAKYHVPGHLLKKPGKYRLAFRLRSRAEPIYFMRFVGADK